MKRLGYVGILAGRDSVNSICQLAFPTAPGRTWVRATTIWRTSSTSLDKASKELAAKEATNRDLALRVLAMEKRLAKSEQKTLEAEVHLIGLDSDFVEAKKRCGQPPTGRMEDAAVTGGPVGRVAC